MSSHRVVLRWVSNGILGQQIALGTRELLRFWWNLQRKPYIWVSMDRLSVSEYIDYFHTSCESSERVASWHHAKFEISILTSNSLFLGHSFSKNPGCCGSDPSLSSQLTVTKNISDLFWCYWISLFAPTLVRQSKWVKERRDMKIEDVVIVADSNVLGGISNCQGQRGHAIHWWPCAMCLHCL